MEKYDIIGDVHGHFNDLVELLEKLGYKKDENEVYSHKERKVIFLGDYIDRGKNQEKTILLIKKMVESKNAQAIMGNHEYNAICYATKDENGKYLREHNDKNKFQSKEFLSEFPLGSEKHSDIINFFMTLPLFLEVNGARFVHASWDNETINFLKEKLNNKNQMSKDFLLKSVNEDTREYSSLETTLKGVQVQLPEDLEWKDIHGFTRKTMRFNWYQSNNVDNYRKCALSFPNTELLPDIKIHNKPNTYSDKIPVFFGHYWFNDETPLIQTPYIVCLDYSVAKNGKLVAYRWDGEMELNNEKLFFVK